MFDYDFFWTYKSLRFICHYNYYLVFCLFTDLKISSKFEDFKMKFKENLDVIFFHTD